MHGCYFHGSSSRSLAYSAAVPWVRQHVRAHDFLTVLLAVLFAPVAVEGYDVSAADLCYRPLIQLHFFQAIHTTDERTRVSTLAIISSTDSDDKPYSCMGSSLGFSLLRGQLWELLVYAGPRHPAVAPQTCERTELMIYLTLHHDRVAEDANLSISAIT